VRSRPALGPGILVTAAFVGPGTITTASAAGANFGFALLWALLFSIGATVILQEMAARLGLVTRASLAEAMRNTAGTRWQGRLAVLLVVLAVGFGNAAYEAGNIAGAALAAATVTPLDARWAALLLGLASGALLWTGRYRVVEGTLVFLVLVMSAVFLTTALWIAPPISGLLAGLFRPSLPEGSALTVIALIGTTVVPYNLFLQANAVREKWPASVPLSQALGASRWDTGLSIGLGGLITLAIVSTAATAFFATGEPLTGASMSMQLEPLLGPAAKYFFAAGLFAGGLTSAITAPLAAAFAVCGALGWSTHMGDARFRTVWVAVLLCGTLFAALGTRPLAAILFAQVANGFLLPVVAVFLLVVMNRRDILGEHCNGFAANAAGAVVVLVAVTLGALKLLDAFGLV